MFAVSILGMFLIAFFLVTVRIMKIKEMEQENQLMQSYMMSIEEFYEGIQNRIEATRKYRHDLAKHIQTLEALLEECSQSEGIQEYMDNLKERYSKLKKQEFGSDEIVSTILSIKKEQCEEKQIPLSIEVEDCSYYGIEEVDFVSLLHNLLDNAIEANERISASERKGIWFSMRRDGERILLDMKNCVAHGEKVTFQTRKHQKEEHGIGTKIIASLVEKYHGTRTFCGNEAEWLFEDRIELVVKK